MTIKKSQTKPTKPQMHRDIFSIREFLLRELSWFAKGRPEEIQRPLEDA